jgi:P27 family predicted phage terminase small subunit
MPGRKPKPTRLKVLTGNPGKHTLNKFEPEPDRGIPSMPEWLTEFPVAVEEWNRESEIIDGMGVLTMAERGMLAQRCYIASQLQEIALDIKKEGRVAYTMKMDSLGNEVMEAKANPKCVQQPKLMTEYRQIGSLLGLDPASRTKLSIDPNHKKSKFDGLIRDASKKQ